ncbi:ABC-2 transporter permease [Staphylococcus capitis]|uniref:ABC-2 transporter permease n=1 Tax=Staphylococcus capitis TaxID=29388 RepID=UPI0036C52117
MKGLVLSTLYATKKPLIIYFIVGIIAAIIMTFLNPTMSGFMVVVLLVSSIADNFKREKDSKWMYYVSTLPVKRADYVKSYYLLFGAITVISFAISFPIVLIITQSLNMALIAFLVCIGCTGLYSALFPFTFKFGPENSNTIIMITVFFMIIIYFVFYILAIALGAHHNSSMTNLLSSTNSLLVFIVFGILGLVTFALTYILSIKIFNKKEL